MAEWTTNCNFEDLNAVYGQWNENNRAIPPPDTRFMRNWSQQYFWQQSSNRWYCRMCDLCATCNHLYSKRHQGKLWYLPEFEEMRYQTEIRARPQLALANTVAEPPPPLGVVVQQVVPDGRTYTVPKPSPPPPHGMVVQQVVRGRLPGSPPPLAGVGEMVPPPPPQGLREVKNPSEELSHELKELRGAVTKLSDQMKAVQDMMQEIRGRIASIEASTRPEAYFLAGTEDQDASGSGHHAARHPHVPNGFQ